MDKRKTSETSKKKALTKLDVFKEFIIWVSMPEPLREPKNQQEFAKKFNVSERTLATWKQRDDFWEGVEKEWNKWGREKTSNVIAKFYQQVIKKGMPADFKLWFQYFLGWSEKSRLEHSGEEGKPVVIEIVNYGKKK